MTGWHKQETSSHAEDDVCPKRSRPLTFSLYLINKFSSFGESEIAGQWKRVRHIKIQSRRKTYKMYSSNRQR